MKKFCKKFIYCTLTLSIILICYTHLCTFNFLKSYIEDKVLKDTGYTLELKGNLKLRLLPYVQIIAKDVTISSLQKQDYICDVHKVKVDLSCANILKHRFAIGEVRLYDANIYTVNNKSSSNHNLDLKLVFYKNNAFLTFKSKMKLFDESVKLKGVVRDISAITPVQGELELFTHKLRFSGNFFAKNYLFMGDAHYRGSIASKDLLVKSLFRFDRNGAIITDVQAKIGDLLIEGGVQCDFVTARVSAEFKSSQGCIFSLNSNIAHAKGYDFNYKVLLEKPYVLADVLQLPYLYSVNSVLINGYGNWGLNDIYIKAMMDIAGDQINIVGNINALNEFDISLNARQINIDNIISKIGKRENLSYSSVKPQDGSSSVNSMESQKPVIWSKKTIDLAMIKKLHGVLTCDIERLIYKDELFSKVYGRVLLDDKKLVCKDLVFQMFGGSVNGNIEIDADDKQEVNVDIAASNINIDKRFIQNKFSLNSLVNLRVKLHSKGNSISDYVQNLSGDINVDSKSGEVLGFNLNAINSGLGDLSNAKSLVNLLDTVALEGKTSFYQSHIYGKIDKGDIKIKKGMLDVNGGKISLGGNVNLVDYTINTTATVSFQTAEIPNFVVMFYGTLDAPQYKINIKNLRRYLLQQTVHGVVKGVLNDSEEGQDLAKTAKSIFRGIFND